MKKPMLFLGMLASLAGCLLWGMCGMTPEKRGGAVGDSYWNSSCVTRDGKSIVAGGDHAAVIEVATGKIIERVAGMVKAVGCGPGGPVIIGYESTFSLPGKTPITPALEITGDAVATTDDGAFVSWTRTITGRKWKGPATLFVTGKGETRKVDLLPALFGKVGEARSLPTADTFAVRVGHLLEDGRLLVAAGWQPSTGEDVPWAFFAMNLENGESSPMTMPLSSDASLNQNLVQKIAATPDGSVMVVAAHDGQQLAVGTFEAGSVKASRVATLPSPGAVSAIAVSSNGGYIAVGSESRGPTAKATAWVLDQTGKVIWKEEFPKTIVGLHFLDDGSLVATSAAARAVRVGLPDLKELWRTP